MFFQCVEVVPGIRPLRSLASCPRHIFQQSDGSRYSDRGRGRPNAGEREEREDREEPGFRGGVVIGNPSDTEPPTYEVEQVGKKHNGDPTFQAVLNIKGQGGRIRSLRAPPRANEDDARDDGEEMKDCFMKHGMPGLRELQQKQRRSRIS
ncbi:unnamed protein product [Symbiodinium sp. CCMP2456]|nr:unnamed protein product [Symbiodinium sp. CCMP2456]